MIIFNILRLYFLSFLPFVVFSQDLDTSTVERESYTSIDFSFSKDEGNTDLDSRYFGFSYTLIGDAGPLDDTEFLIDFNKSKDKLEGYPFTDDESLTLKFDVWANQRLSPFLFFQKSFDDIIGLQDRMNYGLGAKVGLYRGLSISYAFLFEKEDYLLYDFTDSTGTGNFIYTDSVLVDTNDYYYDVGWVR